jgi:hypothetical protein
MATVTSYMIILLCVRNHDLKPRLEILAIFMTEFHKYMLIVQSDSCTFGDIWLVLCRLGKLIDTFPNRSYDALQWMAHSVTKFNVRFAKMDTLTPMVVFMLYPWFRYDGFLDKDNTVLQFKKKD